MIRIAPFFLLCFFLFQSLAAQPTLIKVDKEKESDITSKLSYCEIDTLQDPQKSNCKTVGNSVLLVSPKTNSTVLSFSIHNELSQPLYLVFSENTLERIDIIAEDQLGNRDSFSFGHAIPLLQRPIRTSSVICPLGKKSEIIHYRMIIYSTLNTQTTVSILPQSLIFSKIHTDNLFFGLFFGILIAVILINLFVFIILADFTYLFYSSYQFCGLIILAILNGLFGEFLFPFKPVYTYYLLVFIGISGIFSILFSIRFLKIKEFVPIAYKLCLGLMGFNGILILTILAGKFQWGMTLVQIGAFLNAALLISSAVIVLKKGEQQALYFILGWSCFILGIIMFVLMSYGLLPVNFITTNGLQIGACLQGILLTLAIVQRIQWLSNINSETQAKLLKTFKENATLIKEKNDDLEKKVDERTQEVNFAFQRMDNLKQFYESALNNLPLDISVFDGEARYLFVNHSAIKDPELRVSVIGKTELDYAIDSERNRELHQQRQEMILKAIQKGEKGIIEEQFYSSNGEKSVKQRIIIPVYDDNNQFLYVMGIGIDITDRTKYNQQINQQKDFYERILNSIPIDIHVLSPQLRYLFLNIHSVKDEKIREWMIGKTNIDYCKYRGLDIELFQNRDEQFNKAINRKEIIEFEEIILLKDDSTHVIHRNIKPVFDSHGVPLMLVSFGFDITKLKEIEKQLIGKANELERSNRDLENFAHMASHDFKAPLRVIHSFLQLLEKRSYQKFDETDKEYINYISNSVKILGQLTEDLLSYSKIDKNIGEPKTFDLKDVLELVKVNLKTVIDEKKAIVEYHDLPKVYAHMSLMTHLFQNLITNGIKYNKNEIPRIVINAIQQKEEIIFSIEDNGIGIEPEYFRSIFQMFRRLHPHSEYEGSGIGLTLCKKIVETYDGEVWVESRPGKGSNFFFTLPKAVIPVLQLEETSINL